MLLCIWTFLVAIRLKLNHDECKLGKVPMKDILKPQRHTQLYMDHANNPHVAGKLSFP